MSGRDLLRADPLSGTRRVLLPGRLELRAGALVFRRTPTGIQVEVEDNGEPVVIVSYSWEEWGSIVHLTTE